VSFNLPAFMREWRAVRHADGSRIVQAELDLVRSAIEGRWTPSVTAPPVRNEPKWMEEARRRIGEREIPGPRHNNWIAQGWGRLGARWFNDDETPWCGFFVAHCIDWAKLPIPAPSQFPRALAWNNWGKPCQPAVGAVGVFQRPGGGHVGFLVGENAANYYVLGGNQSNMVNIAPLAKNRLVGTRWPVSLALPTPGLPRMTGGTVSTNEA
jgi:uncharacterized protein (TIGR02594 family)